MKRTPHHSPFLFPEMSAGYENPWVVASNTPRDHEAKACGLSTLELCAGAGGQALGLEHAGIKHAGLIEIDKSACASLRLNRPSWNVIEADLFEFDGSSFKGIDIISGGLPCPPFSVAGKQLGRHDERNLFPAMINLVDQVRPRAVMIENVRGILDAVFQDYRGFVAESLTKLGYQPGWKLMNASDFGVPQLRPRVVFVAVKKEISGHFSWPAAVGYPCKTVGSTLLDLMRAREWRGAELWARQANEIAPTIVGGSKKHGGPDLGPTRARAAWAALGVDGLGIANDAPDVGFSGLPRLTVRMVARIQGFPDEWQFAGTKTQQYRQVGNAFPPPFARAVAAQLRACLLVPRLFRVAG